MSVPEWGLRPSPPAQITLHPSLINSACVILLAGPKSMSSFKVRLFGEFSAVDHRRNTLALGSRRTHAALASLALHLHAPAPLREFAALFGGADAASIARAVRHALSATAPAVLIRAGPPLPCN